MTYVCDEACYAKLLPFHGVGHNDLLLNFNTLNLYPCNTCKEECLDSSKMDCIQCDVCCKWYHSDCAPNMSYSFETYVEKKYLKYFCHIKCELSFLPFYLMKQNDDIDEFNPHDNSPCKVCREECRGYGLDDCIQCDVCSQWLHYECTGHSHEYLDNLDENNELFICCNRCWMCLFPYHFYDKSVIIDNTFNSLSTDNIENRNSISTPTLSLSSSVAYSYSQNSSNYFKNIPFPKSRTVYYDQFLDINCNYLSPNDLDDTYLDTSTEDLVIYHNNIRSLKKNFAKVQDEIFNNCTMLPNIMAFTETKINDSSCIPTLNGYNFEHIDSKTSCGGVGIYLSNDIKYSLNNQLNLGLPGCDDVWVEIEIKSTCNKRNKKSKKETLIIGCVYRHPGRKYENFCEKFCNQLLFLDEKKCKYLVVGDFNIDLNKYNTASNVTSYLNAISSSGCNVFIDKPTRVTAHGGSCIDHVYSNFLPQQLDNYIIKGDISDHFGTLTKIENIIKCEDQQDVYFRKSNLNETEWIDFNSDLNRTLSESSFILNLSNPNEFAETLTSCFQKVINKHMPLRKKSQNNPQIKIDKPWISPAIKNSITNKFKLLHKFQKTKLASDNLKYKTHLNKLTHLIEKARIKYYLDKSIVYGNNKAKTWQLINEISHRKRKSSCNIKRMTDADGNLLEDPTDIANCLNTHFGTVGQKMANKFDDIDPSRLKDPLSLIKKEENQNSMVMFPTNANEVLTLISKLNNKKSSGYDSISNQIIKASSHTITPYLVKLFNICITNGTFPNSYKIAQVIPLFKGGDKESPNSYRPISLLPSIGKLFEKLISLRMVKFLDKFDILSKDQFGFRAKFATEHAITDIHEKLLHNLDNGLNSCAIFLDLAKAFDSVSHKILLDKLFYYGFRGNIYNLLKSYLEGRYQFVKLNDCFSSLIDIVFGVPQGSILGPLLFLIFINDLPDSTNFYVKLFADDTFLCAQNKNFSDLENTVNTELNKLHT